MRSGSPDSSSSVRSQEPFNDNDGFHDISTLQSEFLTQVPPSSYSPNHTNRDSEAILPPLTAENPDKSIQDLFIKPQNKGTGAQNAHSESISPLNEQAAHVSVSLSASLVPAPADRTQANIQEVGQSGHDRRSENKDAVVKEDENGVEEENEYGSIDEDADELPQEQITAYHTQLSASAVSEHPKEVEIAPRAASEASDGLPSMPAAMLDIMRAFRKESLNGRYLPRKLQLVPEAQGRLLEKDESWQPPLIGNSDRQGTVPQDLLNKLIERADCDAIDNDMSIAGMAVQIEQVRGNGRVEAQQTPKVSTRDDLSSSPNSSLDSDGSEVSWSSSPTPSPKRVHLELPPDSPEEDKSGRNTDQVNTEDLMSESIFQSPSEGQRPTKTPSTLSQSQEAIASTEASQESVVNEEKRTSRLSALNVMPIEKLPLNPSTQPAKHTNNSHSARKSVKVHRTPYPNYQADSSPLQVRSSGLTTYLVPATYDERSQRDIAEKKKRREMDIEPSSHDEAMGFEANSSEDGRPMFSGVPVPVLGTKSTPRRDMNSRAIPDERGSKQPAIVLTQSRKRHNETRVDNLEETRRKRSRVSTQQDGEDREEETAYMPVDDLKRRDRRQFYQDLQQKRHSTDQTEARATDRSPLMRLFDNVDPDMQSRSKVFSTAKANEAAGTSNTSLSTHAATSNISKPLPFKKTSDSLQTKNAAPLGLFAEFKRVYPDYRGQQHHFVATCHLLKSLRDKAKATHPSLWDDFVFRHYHDYRDHLDLVRETCGNAMPYEVFYETCVEEPTHHKRIIRPAHLDVPFPLVNFTAPQSKTVKDHATDTSPVVQDAARSIEHVHSEKEEEIVAQETHIDDPVKSQESVQSVHQWLERAAGAQSPELGTPKINVGHDKDVPELILKHLETTSPSHARIVVVPRPMLREDSESSKSKSRSGDKLNEYVPELAVRTPRTMTPVRKSTSFPSTQKKSVINQSSAKSATKVLTPSRTQHKAKVQGLSSSKRQVSSSTIQPHSSTKPEARKSSTVKPQFQPQAPPEPSQEIDTVFTRFMRDYNNLACERGVHTDDPNIQYADFSWITTDHSKMG